MVNNVQRNNKEVSFLSKCDRIAGDDGCYSLDLDMVEIRKLTDEQRYQRTLRPVAHEDSKYHVVAFLEGKHQSERMSPLQPEILKYLARAVNAREQNGCRALIVRHDHEDPDSAKIEVEELYPTPKKSGPLSLAEYHQLLRDL